MTETLVELLRRCHRAELIPLAVSLGVPHERMKRATLVQAIDGRLRRASEHELINLLRRRGHGPPYSEVLRRAAAREGVRVDPADPEAAENALLRAVLARRWAALAPDERQARWERVAGEGPAPADGGAALDGLREARGPGYAFLAHAELAARILPGPIGCIPVLIALRARPELVEAAILEVGRLRQAVRYRVTVGVVGSPSSGKDAAMAAVFGVHTGNIDPVAGSTKAVEIVRLPGSTALFLVNTPGLGDVVASVTEEAKQVLDHIDVYLYVVNAQGGVQAREKADHAACVATGRPVLAVVNKIDTLREEDRDRYLADARQKLGVAEADQGLLAVPAGPDDRASFCCRTGAATLSVGAGG
jgi:GTP-binding protein EngB required for normal cell division